MTAADLNEKQYELLRLMTLGLREKELANRLGISMTAVSGRLYRLKDRIGIRTNFQLGAWAERHGIREPA